MELSVTTAGRRTSARRGMTRIVTRIVTWLRAAELIRRPGHRGGTRVRVASAVVARPLSSAPLSTPSLMAYRGRRGTRAVGLCLWFVFIGRREAAGILFVLPVTLPVWLEERHSFSACSCGGVLESFSYHAPGTPFLFGIFTWLEQAFHARLEPLCAVSFHWPARCSRPL